MHSATRTRPWRLRSSPYWPVLSHRTLRGVLPAVAVSALGDGMSMVGVSWLALRLAPVGQRGLWVALAVAAYTLPGAAGVALFGRFLRSRPAARLVSWDATLRAAAFGTIAVAYLAGTLPVVGYVALLAASSLLHSWGQAGQYTMIAEVLPDADRLAGNAVLSTAGQFGILVGPVAAGLLAAVAGPVAPLCADAVSYLLLAVAMRFAFPAPGGRAAPTAGTGADRTGWRVIRADRRLLALLALTVGFYALYGPVEVALPVHVATDLHGSATLLGTYWTVFGIGALAGSLLAGYLRRWPLWPTTIGIVAGWGLALLPIGLGAPGWLALPAYALGGLIYAPYPATSLALHQATTDPALLPRVLAARSAIVVVTVPAGTLLGAPLIAVLGARATLLVSALATVALAAAAALTVAGRTRRVGSGRRA
ncbi:hypothetical protein GCM10022220_51300 [Actinocatenispora rupis]|uniref:Major Facilitator Superfamily protein n=2 Tax=Actinocatenispora rupis TaxID=519421 RepID=A0A8J3NEA6_9ACTN|nr:hypothetical protein Aru02nite_67050 [Actinocatenispora rupis]